MAEKPRNSRQKGKGFYIAMYSSLAGLLVLAVAIGYYSLLTPGSGVDVSNFAEESLPVAGSAYDGHTDHRQWNDDTQNQPHHTPPQNPGSQFQPGYPGYWPDDYQPGYHPNDTDGYPSSGPDTNNDNQATEAWESYNDAEFNVQGVFEPTGPNFTLFAENDNMHWPVLGEIVMDYSETHVWDTTLDQWRVSDSISIRAERGDAVRAAAAGVVLEVGRTSQFGQIVVIDHGNGWATTYRQLDPLVAVTVGDVVSRGQIIGNVGQPSIFAAGLGHHVNFNVRRDQSAVNPHTILATH
jgi:murein DD-endopeptidase MepM/ murein hydrolase activator NlpD